MSNEIATINVPAFLVGKRDNRGTENIRPGDLRLPRVKLAQALSPELDEGNPQYIDGLKMGNFFNSLTRANYGREFEFTVIRVETPRGVEFISLEDGGGVKDIDVPLDDPRMQFTFDEETGKRVKPIATIFYDYVAILLPSKEPVQLSFKSSGIGAALDLNSLIKYRQQASFAGRYQLSSDLKAGKVGKYAVPSVTPVGFVTEAEYNFASSLYDSISTRKLERVVEDEAAPDKDVPF